MSNDPLPPGPDTRSPAEPTKAQIAQERVRASLKRRYAAEKRFRAYGIAAVVTGIAFVALLFVVLLAQGYSVFQQSYVQLRIDYDPEVIDPLGNRAEEDLAVADYGALLRDALKARFPDVDGRQALRDLYALVSSDAPFEIAARVQADPDVIGSSETLWLLASDDVDVLLKGKIDRAEDGSAGQLNTAQVGWVDELLESDQLDLRFNTPFFTRGDSREPEQAGVWGAAVGSFLTILVTLVLSFPIGVAAAIYLEEFAPRNRWTDLIEVNINNLAAVPSIVFGLLGLAVFINAFGMPRSAPLVGGLVLTLMTLPTIIIASRAAIKAVPPSIREAALGMGASRLQMVAHHVLPLAIPGMLTGTIIGMARALGETAPLLMIGMVAFIVDIPSGFTDPATVLPVQIYLWADSPERAFVERTSGAIIVLLAFLVIMNAAAVFLRNKFERRW
jgi:phosphate transport system permease protein